MWSLEMRKLSWGWMALVGDHQSVRRLLLPHASRPQLQRVLQAEAIQLTEDEQVPAYFAPIWRELEEYFQGKRKFFSPVPLWLEPFTHFTRQVLLTLPEIPYGEVRSYAWLARRVGRPSAARAVGNVLGRNPLPLLLPCHRIIRSNQRLGGFGGKLGDQLGTGSELKRRLLELEGSGE